MACFRILFLSAESIFATVGSLSILAFAIYLQIFYVKGGPGLAWLKRFRDGASDVRDLWSDSGFWRDFDRFFKSCTIVTSIRMQSVPPSSLSFSKSEEFLPAKTLLLAGVLDLVAAAPPVRTDAYPGDPAWFSFPTVFANDYFCDRSLFDFDVWIVDLCSCFDSANTVDPRDADLLRSGRTDNLDLPFWFKFSNLDCDLLWTSLLWLLLLSEV